MLSFRHTKRPGKQVADTTLIVGKERLIGKIVAWTGENIWCNKTNENYSEFENQIFSIWSGAMKKETVDSL